MVLYVVAVLIVLLLGLLLYRYHKLNQLPQGPWGLPIVGYLPFLDKKKPLYQSLDDLGRSCGDIFSIGLGSYQVLVLRTWKIAHECLSMEQFSGRENETYGNKVMVEAGDKFLTHAEGQEWSISRKIGSRAVSVWDLPVTRDRFKEVITEVQNNLLEIISSRGLKSIDPLDDLFPAVAALLETFVYGNDFDAKSDFVVSLQKFVREGTVHIERDVYLKFMPFLRNFRTGISEKQKNDVQQLFSLLRKGETEGEESVSHEVHKLIDRIPEGHNASRDAVESATRSLVSDCYLNGLMGIWENLDWILLLLAKNPNAMNRLHAELDASNSGQKTEPSMEVLLSCNYLIACVSEGLRFASTESITIGNRAVEDVEYRGFKIPKDTVLLTNLWSVNHDSRFFEDELDFKPGRFVFKDNTLDEEKLGKVMAFGTGKRGCLGQTLAKTVLFSLVGFLAFHFDIQVASGQHAVDEVKISSFKVCPGDHTFRFVPRF